MIQQWCTRLISQYHVFSNQRDTIWYTLIRLFKNPKNNNVLMQCVVKISTFSPFQFFPCLSVCVCLCICVQTEWISNENYLMQTHCALCLMFDDMEQIRLKVNTTSTEEYKQNSICQAHQYQPYPDLLPSFKLRKKLSVSLYSQNVNINSSATSAASKKCKHEFKLTVVS